MKGTRPCSATCGLEPTPDECEACDRFAEITEDEIRATLEAAVPGAEELDRKLEPLFRLDAKTAGLVLDSSRKVRP